MSIFESAVPLGFILTADRTRAVAFYSDVMGFGIIATDDFGVTFDMAGLIVRLTDIADHRPGPHTVLGWTVPDIRAAARRMTEKGVHFTIYPGFGQDELGVWSAPDGKTHVNWFADPDGNVLSLSQSA